MSLDWIEKYIEIINKDHYKGNRISGKINFTSIANESPSNLGELYFHQYVNIYPKYLELDKGQQSMVRQKIADASNLKIKTIDNRFSLLNSAYYNGIDINLFKSFNQVTKATSKPKKVSKLPDGITVVWSADEKEINSILSNAIFKAMCKEFETNDWKLINVLKALKTRKD